MNKLLGFIGASLAGYAGWWLAEDLGFMAAFFISTIASGFGLYYGVKLSRRMME